MEPKYLLPHEYLKNQDMPDIKIGAHECEVYHEYASEFKFPSSGGNAMNSDMPRNDVNVYGYGIVDRSFLRPHSVSEMNEHDVGFSFQPSHKYLEHHDTQDINVNKDKFVMNTELYLQSLQSRDSDDQSLFEFKNSIMPFYEDLTNHKKKKTITKLYKCQVCEKPFSHCSLLKMHVRTHTGEKPYTCEICPRSFAHKSHLADHRRIHTGERPFECGMCSMSFARRHHLLRHERAHSKEKVYACKICSIIYPDLISLQNHNSMKHKKKHLCKFCDRTFSHSSHLRDHHKTHTGEKPFHCDMCGMRFARKYHVLRHLKGHLKDK